MADKRKGRKRKEVNLSYILLIEIKSTRKKTIVLLKCYFSVHDVNFPFIFLITQQSQLEVYCDSKLYTRQTILILGTFMLCINCYVVPNLSQELNIFCTMSLKHAGAIAARWLSVVRVISQVF